MGMDLGAEVSPKTLAAWAGGPPLPLPRRAPRRPRRRARRQRAAGRGAHGVAAGLGRRDGQRYLLGGALLLAVGWATRLRALDPVACCSTPITARASSKLVAALLARLERESFATPLLVRLRRALESAAPGAGAALPPSRRVARLGLLVDLLDARRNQIAAILTAPLLWTTQLALAIEALAARVRPGGGALAGGRRRDRGARLAVARSRSSTPRSPFPEPSSTAQPARFDGEALGHPLLPAGRASPTTSRSAARSRGS